MVIFDYIRTPAAEWATTLKDFKKDLSQEITVPIFWGEHETLKGVRDFHSKSRLKLEKLFSIAQTEGVSLTVHFCMSDPERSFPDWMKGKGSTCLVQVFSPQVWFGPLKFCEVPDLKTEECQLHFFSFVDEVLGLLSLYSEPPGAIGKIQWDLGLVRQQCQDPSGQILQEWLEKKYHHVQKLNQVYLTNFKDFMGATKPAGIKVLLQKRPWLLASEYQSLKKNSLARWELKFQSLLEKHQLSNGLSKGSPSLLQKSSIAVIDDTFLELDDTSGSFGPLLIQGEMDLSVVKNFRTTENLYWKARSTHQKVDWLSRWNPDHTSEGCDFFAGQFFPRAQHQRLQEFSARGGKIRFVAGIPKWDENMDFLDWKNIV